MKRVIACFLTVLLLAAVMVPSALAEETEIPEGNPFPGIWYAESIAAPDGSELFAYGMSDEVNQLLDTINVIFYEDGTLECSFLNSGFVSSWIPGADADSCTVLLGETFPYELKIADGHFTVSLEGNDLIGSVLFKYSEDGDNGLLKAQQPAAAIVGDWAMTSECLPSMEDLALVFDPASLQEYANTLLPVISFAEDGTFSLYFFGSLCTGTWGEGGGCFVLMLDGDTTGTQFIAEFLGDVGFDLTVPGMDMVLKFNPSTMTAAQAYDTYSASEDAQKGLMDPYADILHHLDNLMLPQEFIFLLGMAADL